MSHRSEFRARVTKVAFNRSSGEILVDKPCFGLGDVGAEVDSETSLAAETGVGRVLRGPFSEASGSFRVS